MAAMLAVMAVPARSLSIAFPSLAAALSHALPAVASAVLTTSMAPSTATSTRTTLSSALASLFPSGLFPAASLAPSAAPVGLAGALEAPLDEGVVPGWDGLLLAVPKRRTSHSKKRLRQTHKTLSRNRRHVVACSTCGKNRLMHHLCLHCLRRLKDAMAAARKGPLEQQQQQPTE